MQELITDPESGIVLNNQAQAYLKNFKIDCHPIAKGQHAQYAELCGALLRDAIHRVEGRLEEHKGN